MTLRGILLGSNRILIGIPRIMILRVILLGSVRALVPSQLLKLTRIVKRTFQSRNFRRPPLFGEVIVRTRGIP